MPRAEGDGKAPAEGDKEALLAAIGSLSQKAEEDNLTDAESKQVTKDYKTLQKDMKKIIEGEGEAAEKLEQLQAKYLSVCGEVKRWQSDAAIKSRKLEKANAARDLAQQEHSKMAGVKTKLETLCRELQKQNKAVMDDSKRVQEEEHAKRQELSAKFQDTIKDVSTKLDAQGEDRIKQFEENDQLREKLKNFADQYELREQHFAHQLKTKELEQQLNEAPSHTHTHTRTHADHTQQTPPQPPLTWVCYRRRSLSTRRRSTRSSRRK